jgi:hypothetical protein
MSADLSEAAKCEWERGACSNPERFIMRCANSGFTYGVCGIHRRTATAAGDSVWATVSTCPTCKRGGWRRQGSEHHA